MSGGFVNIKRHCRYSLLVSGLLLLNLVGCARVFADESIRFDHLTTEDGLPQSVINSVVQDQQGFMWFATQSGVARYDGADLQVYRHDSNDAASLSQDWVWALAADHLGQTWFGTSDAGLCRLAAQSTTFVCIGEDPQADLESETEIVRDIDTGKDHATPFESSTPANYLSSRRVRSLHIDPFGSLWVGTDEGLDRIDLASNTISSLRLPVAQPLEVTALESTQEYLWIGGANGELLRYEFATQQLTDLSSATQDLAITAVKATTGGGVWVATSNSGLFRLMPDGTVEQYQHNPNSPSSLPSNHLTSLLLAHDDTLWIGTYNDGLIRFDAQTQSFTQFSNRSDFSHSLSDDHVVSLYQDAGNVIWVGTFSGVHKWNPQLGNFSTYRRSRGSTPGLSNQYVTSFAQRTANEIWVGTHGGLNHIDRISGAITHLRADPRDATTLNDNKVFSLQFDTVGGLWIGTMNGGLNYMAPGARVIAEPFDLRSPTPIKSGITSLLLDATGDLWVGTYAAGLFRVDPINLKAQRFEAQSGEHALGSATILSLLEDTDGQLWVGTAGQGLFQVNLSSGEISQYQHDANNSYSLSSDVIYALHEDRDGNLWVGTDNQGLNQWSAAMRHSTQAHFQRYGPAQGLPMRTVHAILSQPNGVIWFSTNAGLVRFNPAEQRSTLFTVTHGLQSSEFNFAAALHAKDGQMLFGGIEGFNLFDPEAISTNPHPPPLALTGFTRGHEAMPLFDPQADEPKIKHADQMVSFEYVALDYTAPHKNLYQHRLLGFNDSWTAPSNERRATYTNLDPGTYQLQARAANNDGVWSTKRLNVRFEVTPPPWNTPLMRALYAAIVLFMIAALYYNFQRLRENALAIRERNRSLRHEIRLRREQERALVVEKQINQQYLDVVEVMIVLLDSGGNIIRINQKGERILGYPQRELVHKNFYELIIPDDCQQSVREHFEHLAPDTHFESPALTRSGQVRTIAWHTARLPRYVSGGAHLITSGMDMTQLRELERRMNEAQKMEALGNLARGIAHDFNNILSGIVGYAELGLADLPSTSPVATNLHRLQFSAGKARELVDAILTFSRQEQYSPEHVVLSALLQEGVQLIEPMLPKNVTLHLRVDTPEVTVLGDPPQLLRLVTNLCTNAYQAMEETGGMLSIELDSLIVTGEEQQPEVSIRSGDYVRLTVHDNGVGMSAEMQTRIFDPFFTTKPREQGTGLGLSVVHGIVRQMGGSIRTQSQLGHGSSFTVLLPASTPDPDSLPVLANANLATDPDNVPIPQGEGTILFVDDEQTVLHIAEQLLSRQGYRVITAENGERALAILENPSLELHCLITDQSMPRLRGTELAAKARAIRNDLPIILISGGGDDHNSAAIDLYLQKPYTQFELANAIHSVTSAPNDGEDGGESEGGGGISA